MNVAARDWLQLSLTRGIGPILIARLIAAAGGAQAACAADAALLEGVEGIGSVKSRAIAAALREAARAVDDELARAQAAGARVICPDDPSYPLLLRSIPDPPAVLYVRGEFEPRDLHALAIVGSRRCSYYGREQAERFAALLAGAGMTVISGGARGVDSAAHRGALSHPHGRTIAVLGSGIDVAYPPENEPLFERIAQRGAVVSEYPMGAPPAKENFPRRNRIVSGMSRGVLVVEADERSGALITARQAADDHNRTVFALPGRVDSPTSAGPHQLIRDGAVLTARLEDILDALGPLPNEAMEEGLFAAAPDDGGAGSPVVRVDGGGEALAADAAAPAEASPAPSSPDLTDQLSSRQRRILEKLGAQEVPIDRLIDLTGLPAGAVLQEMTFLTLKGLVRRTDGQTFARRR